MIIIDTVSMVNGDICMIYKLMIKTHMITGLKYMCITKRKDWKTYTGSGTYWKAHLKKHGSYFDTELLYESDDYNDFAQQCLFYSELYQVSLSDEFANQIPESGYDNTENGYCNFEIWWKYASDLIKSEVIQKRNLSISLNHWAKNIESSNIKEEISNKQISHWNTFTLDERRKMTENIRIKAKNFFKNKDTIEYKKYIESQSKNMLNYYGNISFEILSKRNRNQRLNTSPESKQSRINKIREVYATGKHDGLFYDMSIKRKGTGNPAVKIIVWNNIEYPKLEFKKFLKDNNIKECDANYILDNHIKTDCYRKYDTSVKQYDIMECPYCNKKTNSNNKPSSFKRWHFENCKERIKND